MRSETKILSGIVITAASMYLLDLERGRRRRAQLRDRIGSSLRKASHGLNVAARDLAHRTRGLTATARVALDDRPVGDEVVLERVRSALGRVVSHPGSIHVTVVQGRVDLTGAILTREYATLIRAVSAVRGVKDIEDRLDIHDDARHISALQGGRVREPARFALLQNNWSPAVRLLTGAAGLGLMVFGLRTRQLAGSLSGAAGGALLLRSVMNTPLTQLASGQAIEIHKTLRVNAPIDQVFDTFASYENFPYFMRNVRSVRAHPDGRSHWCVTGPAGTTIEWDAETILYRRNEVIEWRTVPHATVQHSGRIQFQSWNGGTRVEIEMRYRPPAGALGHGLARLFGVDPRTELDEDLLRLKTFLETGRRAHDSATRVRGVGTENDVVIRVPPEPLRVEPSIH
jgi:uncharacterized membrane protein